MEPEPVGTGTDLSVALDELNRAMKRHAVVFAVSDYQEAPEEWSSSMKRAALRHDLIPIVVGDEREAIMPNVGMIELQDSETGQRTFLDTSRRSIRNRFREQNIERDEAREKVFRRMRLDPIKVETGGSFIDELTGYFQRRERRQRR